MAIFDMICKLLMAVMIGCVKSHSAVQLAREAAKAANIAFDNAKMKLLLDQARVFMKEYLSIYNQLLTFKGENP